MNRSLNAIAAAVVALAAASSVLAQGRAPDLEVALVRKAPEVIKHFQAKGYGNVGVLKFLIVKDGQRFDDNVGTLNKTLADRLEVALVLANDVRRPVGIIRDASAVANRIPGASHLSGDGRRRLFDARYPLAWGSEQVSPNAFVTGTAQVSPDLKLLTVSLMVFDKTGNKLEALGEDFVAANQADKLTEMGESFMVRGLFDGGAVEQTGAGGAATTVANQAKHHDQVLEAAAKVKHQAAESPLHEPAAPIKLTVLYDDAPVPFELKGGKAFIPEPREGQKVKLGIGRNDTRERLGVVIKINGENTIERERLPDAHSRVWVIEPGKGPYEIRGFQKGGDTAEEFRVLSVAESKQREVNYGTDVGTITMTVFREFKGKEKPQLFSDEAVDATVVAKAKFPDEKKDSYAALKSSLLAEANTRGLIAEGHQIESKVDFIPFKPDPVPIMSATIFYYKR
jgi:hypothetical protein